MPGAVRPNRRAMKIAYRILKTPKDKQQDAQPIISDRKKREWFRDSSTAQ